MDFSTLLPALAAASPATLLAAAVVYLYRDGRQAREAHAADIKALSDEHAKQLGVERAAHLATMQQVIPLASRLADVASDYERLMSATLARAGDR